MFDFVRKHTKVMMFLMFLLIIPAFVLVGIDGFKSMGSDGAVVAKVGSHSIKQGEWDAAHKMEVDRMRASMPNLDAKLLDSPQARYVTLERLVRERVLAEAALVSHLTTTNARLANELQQNPTIASLRKPDGSLDMDRYRQLAASQGFTPEGFEARVRNDLSVRQVESGVVATAFSTAAVADVSLNAFFEKREIQIARFNPADFTSKVVLTDADIEAFYQANAPLFQAPESASIEYVLLDLDTVKKGIVPDAQEVKSYYEQNVARLSGKEERRASHILINAPKDMPAAEREKAKARAAALLEQVRKAPASFAEVARKNSQDTGSAPNGGDLDFFGHGAMVKPFEDAVFAMKKGDISDVVESDFGFHIIKLTDVKTPKQKSFEELRAGIEADLRTQQAQRKFAEIAESFTNGVYEQSDTLKPIADKLKLEVKTATGLQRNPAPGATGVLANPKLLAAVFSPESVDKKRNTEALEIAPNQLASARITQYTAARTLPLTEVRANVRERLLASRSAELAKKEGESKLAAWKADASGANLPAAVVVSREPGQTIQGAVLNAALSTDTSKLPGWSGVDLGAQGYAVLRVNKVMPRTPVADSTSKQERAQYAQWVANAENQAYYQLLKDRFKAQIKVPRPTGAVGSASASAE
ncbi:SurA N-terminal domain-containing protein [Rhodoferax saidenbachensis]|uniref:Periplasmic chaperone PpiD n=1 Tax=Rhodoferax saidenbachensis TaxID=1484693 RepID=A0A1P8K973_9BURK|nr:SurA N-terminal domain-containing protein [Rhodoferax saidenbachensis]APW42542.1 peptidylprolyl isomerase [Rhodoferax saidenbachensis]